MGALDDVKVARRAQQVAPGRGPLVPAAENGQGVAFKGMREIVTCEAFGDMTETDPAITRQQLGDRKSVV